MPTFTDLFYKSATHEANPNLKPEEATVYEIGEEWVKNAWAIGVTIFYRQGRNIIDWVYTEGSDKSKSQNYSHVNAAGAEFSCQWNPAGRNIKSFIQQMAFNYTFTALDKESAPQTTSYALDYLKQKANVSLEHLVFFEQLKASWSLTFYDRAGTYVDHVSGATAGFTPFTLLDVRLRWERARFSMFVEAINLGATAYFDYGGLLQPGRWLIVGVLLKL